MVEKRPIEEEITLSEKKHDHFAKGVAPIKPEYLVSTTDDVVEDYNDDEAEGGDRQEEAPAASGKGRKRKGQNKNRDLRQQHEDVRLCSALVDPESGRVCQFGPDNCRNCHDIDEYFANKQEDIDGVCPVFEAIGYCPLGLKCRWLNSHYNKETKKLVKDLAKQEAAKDVNCEVNKISNETKILLQKKKYEFKYANSYIPYLDSLVQSETNIAKQKAAEEAAAAAAAAAEAGETSAEQTKENAATYVEAPFKVAEKKRLHLKGAKIVSPLTTVGNLPYRRLMKTLGADVTYSEMALALPLLQATNAEWALPKAHKSEYPGFGVQIATSKHWAAAKAAEVLYRETTNVSEINLNCGCPIDLLYRQGQGSALMEQPARLSRILNGMNACSGDIPVTFKIRTGTKDGHNNAKQLVSRILSDNTVAAITLHGRTRQQRYTKEADWNYIAEVGQIVQDFNHKKEEDKESAECVPTQFVGNGDIFNFEDWHNATKLPGIDSVMIARGALIKPWIFEEIDSQQYLDKSATERLAMLEQYSKFAIEHWGSDEYGVGLARRFLCEFMSFTHRYIPVGIMERLPAKLNQRPPQWKGRNELETLLGSKDYKDWIKITEMFLGKANKGFLFIPKHKSNSN